eukprot:10229040-Prorocentrum_lima.AAC.1
MTSSLVGSEMCIRDSIYTLFSPIAPAPPPPRPRHTPFPYCPLPPCTFPVSYTHLTLPTICSV